MKQQYYDIRPILAKDCQINLLIGERSNGKSYSVKDYALTRAWKSKQVTFGIIRRYAEDVKSALVESYFADMPINKYTNNEYDTISVYRSGIYFAKHDENGKIIRGQQCGQVFALALDERYKSTEYPFIYTLIFEEFITKNGYLKDEPLRLMNLMSTIFRRRSGKLFMVGNTISRVCPYTTDFGLKNLSKQQPATIDIYEFKDMNNITTRIGVEYCATTSAKTSGLFFGKFGKQIDGGSWECAEYPRLSAELSAYNCLYELSLVHNDFAFNIKLLSRNSALCVYVYPSTLKTFKRVLTEKYENDMMITPCLYARNKREKLIAILYRQNKFVFSDNLTGEDFTSTIKNMKINPFNLV